MNLLAHLHLGATVHPGTAGGNLLADYRRQLPPAAKDDWVELGVRLHRRIDACADAHPLHREARACVAPPRRRLAGIMVDVFFDYFLTRHWARFEPRPLPDFVNAELDRIARHLRDTRSVHAPFLARLQQGRWLLSYGTLEGLGQTFARIAARAPAVAHLAGAESELARHAPALERLFLDFYPDLIARCAPRRPPAQT